MSFYRGIVIAVITGASLATRSGHAVHQSQQYGCSHRLQSLNMLRSSAGLLLCRSSQTLVLICT